MKIATYFNDTELTQKFETLSKSLKKKDSVIIISCNTEDELNEVTHNQMIDAYVIYALAEGSQVALDFIKSKNPFVVTLVIGALHDFKKMTSVDIFVPCIIGHIKLLENDFYALFNIVTSMIFSYVENFKILKRLMHKNDEPRYFGNFRYEPLQRAIYREDTEIGKLSEKEGGIFEVLLTNFGKVVKKEVIMELVWKKSDYFTSRSMDVYVSHLRNRFKSNSMNINIRNVSGVGLILEKI